MPTTTRLPNQPPTPMHRRRARVWTSLSLAGLCSFAPTGAQAFELDLDLNIEAPSSGEGHADLVAVLDPIIHEFLQDNKLPGIQVAVSKDANLVFSKAYGMANVATNETMQPYHRNRIGSVSKIVNALTILKIAESMNPNLALLDKPVYGPAGLLPSAEPEYAQLLSDQLRGRERHTPVVGTIIAPNDLTYTYYDDDDPDDDDDRPTFSIGRTYDLDAYSHGNEYELPPGQSVRDIRGMAASPDGFVYTWFSDGTLSKGTFDKLYIEEDVEPGEIDLPQDLEIPKVEFPTDQRADFLVGVGFAKSSGKAYAWFEDGTRAYGTPMDLRENVDTYTTPDGEWPYDIRSMAIASNDRVYTFYGDDKVSAGTSRELDAYRTLYDTSIAADITPQPWDVWHGTITLRNLLSHTAGFRKNISAVGGAMMFHPDENPWDAAPDLGVHDLHRYALSAGELVYEPGTKSDYSNHGARLAGWVLEELLNLPWKVIADLMILDPLGLDMKRAWDPLDEGDASPHTSDTNGDPVACFASCPVDVEFGEQSGYLTASAEDLVRLMLATDQDPNHDDILLPSTLDTMETSTIAGSLMGWRGNTHKLHHSGSAEGGGSSIAKYRSDNVTVAIVINIKTDAGLSPLRDELAAEAANIIIPANYDLF